MKRDHLLNRMAGFVAVLALAAVVAGCAAKSPTAPPAESLLRLPESDPPAFVRTPDVPFARGQFAVAAVVNPVVLDDSTCTEAGEQRVEPDRDTSVNGGRCRMEFHPGDVNAATDIWIGYWDDDVLAFQFKPEGTVFNSPIELCVDLSGTNVDPNSSNFDGTRPKFFWLNETDGVWEEMAGEFDEANMKFKVQLHHFSKYAVGSKAGW